MRIKEHLPMPGYGRLFLIEREKLNKQIDKWLNDNPDAFVPIEEEREGATIKIIEWALYDLDRVEEGEDWIIPKELHCGCPDYLMAVANITSTWFRKLPPIERWMMTRTHRLRLQPGGPIKLVCRSKGSFLELAKMTDGEVANAIKHDTGKAVSKDAVKFWRKDLVRRQRKCKA